MAFYPCMCKHRSLIKHSLDVTYNQILYIFHCLGLYSLFGVAAVVILGMFLGSLVFKE